MKTKNKLIAVVGDIHGCINTFKKLYSSLLKFNVPVYSVGDFIDRGKNSNLVVEFMRANKIPAVMGNHERWFLDAMNSKDEFTDFRYWAEAGGGDTMLSYFDDVVDVTIKTFKEMMFANGHYDFISTLPLKIEINNVFISHAGKVVNGDESSLYFNRGLDYEKIAGKFQVFGHRSKEELVYEEGWYANIDTGCVYGNKLTGVVVDTVEGKIAEVVSVRNME